MALSETFRPEIVPAERATRARIPITARELVEWTYAVQRAQGVPELTLEPQGRSQTSIVVDRMIEFAQLGCRVDVSSNAAAIWGETRCHEDAITVHAIIGGMSRLSDGRFDPIGHHRKVLLIDHGHSRTPPNWQPKVFPLACVPVKGKRGGERGIYLGSGRALVGHEVTYAGDWPSREAAAGHKIAADAHTRLWADQSNWPAMRRRRSDRPMVAEHEWAPEPHLRCADEVSQRARDEYRAWYEALWALCDGLEAAGPPGLTRYRISDLGAVYEPWRV